MSREKLYADINRGEKPDDPEIERENDDRNSGRQDRRRGERGVTGSARIWNRKQNKELFLNNSF